MWDLILNPFITVLLLLYQLLFQNVVLAIAAFTILIRLLTHPLTRTQMRSSAAMQELQPKLKKLQEKYKGDREKMAQAQMELYREYGFNPLGGCLPLLIQLPILIGLYQAIIQALAANPLQLMELSGRVLIPGLNAMVPMQNQFLWLNLAQPDPTLILPILVLATTWIQQRLIMPPSQSTDNNQAASMTRSMTTVMPILYFFFALSFASGLSIYFIISNIIGSVQYLLMGKADIRNVFRFGSGSQPKTVTAAAGAGGGEAIPARTAREEREEQRPVREAAAVSTSRLSSGGKPVITKKVRSRPSNSAATASSKPRSKSRKAKTRKT